MKWIKLEKLKERDSEYSGDVVYFPNEIAKQLPTKTKLVFGQREISVMISEYNSTEKNTGNHFHQPLRLKCSAQVFEQLLFQESATYQMYTKDNMIRIGPVIGFLLGDQHYYYHDRRLKELSDAMGVYEHVGGLYIAFRHCSISWQEKCIYGQFYNYSNQKWEYGKLPFPSVVYRRGFNSKNNFVTEVADIANWKVFNEKRFDKWEMYKLLKENKQLHSYVPETAILTTENLISFLTKYTKVILKPHKLSRGRGISIISTNDDGTLTIQDYRKFTEISILFSQLQSYLVEGNYIHQDYIIQPFIPLAQINGRPWDIRVVMQKNRWKNWVCSGIECRLAGPGKMITNISNGGSALHLREALALAFDSEIAPFQVEEEIEFITKHFCEMMDETGDHFAEFGIDLALDQQKHFWFIEANVRPTFKGFQLLDERIYRQICYEPILYSASIAGFGWEENDETNIQNYSGLTGT
jgi:glutathione synthase/RimK-type ligase-like ATP-grasp enzyme